MTIARPMARGIARPMARPLLKGVGRLISLGDSHTLALDYGVSLTQHYPYLAASILGWRSYNFGISGNTTAQMLSRIATTMQYGVPDVATVYGKTNDNYTVTTVAESPAPTSTTFSISSNSDRYTSSEGGWITVDGELAQIQSVSGAEITLTSPLTSGAPTAGDAVMVDAVKNLSEITAYWQGQGVSRIVVLQQHYLNWASGGDTTSAENVSAAASRAEQLEAALAMGVAPLSLYTYMRQLIVDGAYTQGDDLAWHVGIGNSHLNATGHAVLAAALVACIVAQEWIVAAPSGAIAWEGDEVGNYWALAGDEAGYLVLEGDEA